MAITALNFMRSIAYSKYAKLFQWQEEELTNGHQLCLVLQISRTILKIEVSSLQLVN